MARLCPVTGKRTTRGYKYAIRGIAKKKKGIGLKVTGKTRRCFRPNLQTKRFWYAEENRFVTMSISTHGMRTIDKHGLDKVIRQMRAEGVSI